MSLRKTARHSGGPRRRRRARRAVRSPVLAQEFQDEGVAYRAWHAASQAADNAKAMEAAKAYLEPSTRPASTRTSSRSGWLRPS